MGATIGQMLGLGGRLISSFGCTSQDLKLPNQMIVLGCELTSQNRNIIIII